MRIERRAKEKIPANRHLVRAIQWIVILAIPLLPFIMRQLSMYPGDPLYRQQFILYYGKQFLSWSTTLGLTMWLAWRVHESKQKWRTTVLYMLVLAPSCFSFSPLLAYVESWSNAVSRVSLRSGRLMVDWHDDYIRFLLLYACLAIANMTIGVALLRNEKAVSSKFRFSIQWVFFLTVLGAFLFVLAVSRDRYFQTLYRSDELQSWHHYLLAQRQPFLKSIACAVSVTLLALSSRGRPIFFVAAIGLAILLLSSPTLMSNGLRANAATLLPDSRQVTEIVVQLVACLSCLAVFRLAGLKVILARSTPSACSEKGRLETVEVTASG